MSPIGTFKIISPLLGNPLYQFYSNQPFNLNDLPTQRKIAPYHNDFLFLF